VHTRFTVGRGLAVWRGSPLVPGIL
jgi:hypothetical protein